jgi:hypothetical protein
MQETYVLQSVASLKSVIFTLVLCQASKYDSHYQGPSFGLACTRESILKDRRS